MTQDTETSQNDGGISNDVLPRRRNRSLVQMVKSRHIESSINRSQGQLNSPDRFGGNKLGSKKRKAKEEKKAAAPKGISPNPPERRPTVAAEDDIQPQTANVTTYLAHIKAVPANTYSHLFNSCWGDERISEVGYGILESLPQTPTYALRFVNRIFCYDSWQNIPREDRPIVFGGCHEADFTSLHFQIFMMLLRKHLPDDAAKIQEMMGDQTIWDWWQDQGIAKTDAKTPVQMLINCKSAKQTILMFEEPERQTLEDEPPIGWHPTRFNKLSPDGRAWIKAVNRARNKLVKLIQAKEIVDAFGNPLPNLKPFEYFMLKGEWKPFWKLVRTDLNTLYSSYELKLITDTVGPVIRGYERFKLVLHLHDGFLFQVGEKYKTQVFKKLERDSDKILKAMDIKSKLNLPKLDQMVPI